MKTLLESESVADAELVELCLRENRNAFASIIARYQSLICALAYSACGDVGRSEDIAQDTFIVAWKSLRELKEPAKLKSWLCGIARNLVHNSVRQDRRTPTALADPLQPEACDLGANPHEQAVSREEESLVWRALEAIPAAYREPMVLFYREGQSAQSVAAALDLSEEAVWQRLSRGRAMLKAGLEKTVESALFRSAPGKAFTGAVLAALPGFAVSSAKAATVATAIAKGGPAAKTATFGWAGAGGYLGYLGFGYFSLKSQIENTKSPRERQFMVRMVWLRTAVFIVMIGLMFAGFRALRDEAHDPLTRNVAIAAACFGLAVYSVAMFEFTHRRCRRIQVEDGTFVASEWAPPEQPRESLSSVPGGRSKLWAIGIVWVLMTGMSINSAAHGHWGAAVGFLAITSISVFRGVRAMRRWPRFEARLAVSSRLPRTFGVFTLIFYNLSVFRGHAGAGMGTHILFNAVVVLAYAALIGMIAWVHRLRPEKTQPHA